MSLIPNTLLDHQNYNFNFRKVAVIYQSRQITQFIKRQISNYKSGFATGKRQT